MTVTGPWSVKGIDPKAREIAKDLARRSGMTLGDWLNQMIIEGGEPEAETPPPAPEPRRPLDELYREAQAGRRGAAPSRFEGGDTARFAHALESLATRVEAGEHRSVLAISGIDQSVMGVLSRLDEVEHGQEATGARIVGSVSAVRQAQADIAERLRRLEGEDGAVAGNLQALEAALGRIAVRMDETAAKADAGHDLAKTASDGLSRRLDRVETVVEAAPAAYADAEKVETVLTRMAERLDTADTRTGAAVQSLQASFATLDARVRASEARSAGSSSQEMERRFQTLAHELSQRVDASRADLAQRLRAAADGRLEKVETTLHDLGGRMEQAEKRSAQTIDRIGREVVRVAHSLGERVSVAEHKGAELAERTGERLSQIESRTAAAAESVGGEVARIADAMETRLHRADTAQAEALEKLGGEIERIAERLAERISTADRRSAEAIDEVTDRVVKLGSRMDERQDANSGDFAERIRASEERTAKLIDEARARLDQRLADPAPPPIVTTSPLQASVAGSPGAWPETVEPAEPPAVEPSAAPRSNADPFADAFTDLDAATPAMIEPAAAEVSPAPPVPAFAGHDPFTAEDPFAHRNAFAGDDSPFNADEDFVAGPAFAPALDDIASAGRAGVSQSPFGPASFDERPRPSPDALEEPTALSAFGGFSVSDFAAAPEPDTFRVDELRPEQRSTREMLDVARQAARRAAQGKGAADAPAGSIPALPLEPAAAHAPRPFGITFPGRRKKETAPTLRTFVLASGIAGSLTAMGVGAYLLGGVSHDGARSPEMASVNPNTPLAPSAAPALAVALVPPIAPHPAAPDAATDLPPAAVATAKAPATTARASAARAARDVTTSTPPSPAHSARALYASAVSRLDSGDLTALPDLKASAEAGDKSAQFYLARLYDAGADGLKKDVSQARLWTGKAAESGEPSAMYNYASYLYAGDGGARDPAQAATWFRKAAEHGVVNGQYNLAQLYEKGYGVGQSLPDAYKWYLVAAGSGDTEARAAAASLKPKLSPDAQAAAEHSALQQRAGLSGVVKTAAATPAQP